MKKIKKSDAVKKVVNYNVDQLLMEEWEKYNTNNCVSLTSYPRNIPLRLYAHFLIKSFWL